MRIQRKRKKRIDIAESGALSDLAFLLIIFFIVIAVFNVNTGFLLGLPRKNTTRILNIEDIVKIDLQADGVLTYDGSPVTVPDLESIVDERLSIRPNMTLLLTISPDVPYQSVVEVVDFVRKREVENFSFRMAEEGA
jgi:biopolymer transport protein ExbD